MHGLVNWDGFWRLAEDIPEQAFDQMEAVRDALLQYVGVHALPPRDQYLKQVGMQQLEQVSGPLDKSWSRKMEASGSD